MLVYYALLVGLTVVGIPLCRLKHGKKIYCCLAGLALFAVAAIREGVGYDYNSYGTMFLSSRYRFEFLMRNDKNEKGFLLPLKYLSDFTDYYQILFIIMAAVFAAAVMIYIYLYTEKAYLGVFCFLTFGVFFNTLCFLRQMLAAVVVMYALQYIKKKQFLRFLVLVLFASTFHVSALLMVLFYFILQIKMNWVSLGVYTGGLVLFFIFSEKILGLITKYFYTGYQIGLNVEITTGLTPIYSIFFGIFFALAFAVRKRLCKKNSFNNVYLNCMYFVFFFEAMGVKHAIVSRLSILFIIPATIVLIPEVVTAYIELFKEKFGKNRNKATISTTVVLTVFATFCTCMYTFMLVKNYNGVMPYQTIFSEEGSADDGAD